MAILKHLFLLSLVILASGFLGVQGQVKPTKLFVFGDSTADTGNTDQYKSPYGETFPGKPSGRASNGLVSTDFLAQYMEIESPVPYVQRESGNKTNGMNFAYGGAAVIKAFTDYPNVAAQVELFKKLIEEGVYTKDDLKNSVALFSYGGNDYSYYAFNNQDKLADVNGWVSIMNKVVTEFQHLMRTVNELGVPKVIINTITPSGCVPQLTAMTNYTTCIEDSNKLAKDVHNTMLYGLTKELNKQKGSEVFVVIDYFNAVLSVIQEKGAEDIKFEKVYEPCCDGIPKGDYACGVENKYTLCADPTKTFYWDAVHYTEQGWRAVFSLLKPNLSSIFKY